MESGEGLAAATATATGDTGRIAGATDGAATATGEGTRATEQPVPEMPVGGASGLLPDLRRTIVPVQRGFLSDDEVALMMAVASRFLLQVTQLVSAVCGTLNVGGLRGEFAEHIPVARDVFDESGELLLAPRPAPVIERADHRTGPRGRRSPMAMLLALGVQAAKMLQRITRGTNPVAHDIEPFWERLDREAARREPYANDL